MARYIDAEKLIEWSKEVYPDDKAFISAIKNAPTADVQKVKHGKWEYIDGDVGYSQVKCSSCGKRTVFGDEEDMAMYCPKCGAKMGESNEHKM